MERPHPSRDGALFSIRYLGPRGQCQAQAVHPSLHRRAGGPAAEPLAVQPCGIAGETMEVRSAGTNAAAAGGTEGYDGFSAQIVALQEPRQMRETDKSDCPNFV